MAHDQPLASPIVRFGISVGIFACLIGAPISGYFLWQVFREAQVSAAWPSTPGTLLKAQVGGEGTGRYFADVAYVYHVGAEEHTGTRVRASHGTYNIRDGAVQALAGLSAGQPVAVYYNPAKPSEAVLKPGAGFAEYALLFVPFAMFGFGLWRLMHLWRTRHLRRASYQ